MKRKAMVLFALFFALLLQAAILVTGCTTTQSPNRQAEDLRITAEVKSKLSEIRPTSVINIEVNTTNGIVTLAGQVETEDVKQSAEAATRSVAGVVDLNNNLQVEGNGQPAQPQPAQPPQEAPRQRQPAQGS